MSEDSFEHVRVIPEERNNSGQYQILLNGEHLVECEAEEIETLVELSQSIKSTTFSPGKEMIVRMINLIDKESGDTVGFRLLPKSLTMQKEDCLMITWSLSMGRGFVN